LFGLFFDPEYGGNMPFQKGRWALNGLCGDMFQKTELFVITAVGTSNPTTFYVHILDTVHSLVRMIFEINIINGLVFVMQTQCVL
jgi:hypothetical protein